MGDQSGLRGVCAVWIVAFHCFTFSQYKWDLEGSTLMPLFFLLSGFSMTIGYSGRLQIGNCFPSGSTLQVPLLNPNDDLSSSQQQSSGKSQSISRYLYNRFIRVMPVYWIALAFALPPVLAGYGQQVNPSNQFILINALIINVIPVMTWVGFYCPYPVNGPEWTVMTLWFFWLFFPWLLARYEKMSDIDLLECIRRHYWIQFAIVLVGTCLDKFTDVGLGFAVSSQTPYCRIFVFTMGIQAGLLCLRHPLGRLPWFSCTGSLFPWKLLNCCSHLRYSVGKGGSNTPNSNSNSNRSSAGGGLNCVERREKGDDDGSGSSAEEEGRVRGQWGGEGDGDDGPMDEGIGLVGMVPWGVFAESCNAQSIKLLSCTLVLCVVETCSSRLGGAFLDSDLWFQGLNVFAQLDLIVGLTRSQGLSRASAVLRHPVWVWMGELSMSLYLIHWPIIYYICWAVHGGPVTFPSDPACHSLPSGSAERTACDEWEHANHMPYWGVAVVPPAALLLSCMLYYGVEEPIRKYFK